MTPEEADRKIKQAWAISTSPAIVALHDIDDEIKRLEAEFHRQARDMLAAFRKTYPEFMKDFTRIRERYHTR